MTLSRRAWTIIHRGYDATHVVLGGILAVWVVVLIATLPRLPQIHANIERMRMEEIAQENERECERLGMRVKIDQFIACATVLDEVRANAGRRIGGDSDF